MTDGAVFPQIQVEAVVLFLQAQLLHTRGELLQVILSLASADDLTDARYQAIHGGYGLAVLVQLHVEGLDILRIIGNEDRALEYLLGQVTLMLGLQVAAPAYFVIKVVVVLLQNLDGLGIGHMAELGVQDTVESLQQTLVYKLVEEVHLFRSILQYVIDNVFQHGFSHFHVILQIREGHLRLDHPELCRMAGGIGILGAEGRSEGIDVTEGHGVSLAV